MKQILIKNAYWDYNPIKGCWYLADALCDTIIDSYGTWVKSPHGLIRIGNNRNVNAL